MLSLDSFFQQFMLFRSLGHNMQAEHLSPLWSLRPHQGHGSPRWLPIPQSLSVAPQWKPLSWSWEDGVRECSTQLPIFLKEFLIPRNNSTVLKGCGYVGQLMICVCVFSFQAMTIFWFLYVLFWFCSLVEEDLGRLWTEWGRRFWWHFPKTFAFMARKTP